MLGKNETAEEKGDAYMHTLYFICRDDHDEEDEFFMNYDEWILMKE